VLVGGYITKPINADELEAAILAALLDTTEIDNEKSADKHKGEESALEYG
jgi:DNA-binding response OmpR family regulator